MTTRLPLRYSRIQKENQVVMERNKEREKVPVMVQGMLTQVMDQQGIVVIQVVEVVEVEAEVEAAEERDQVRVVREVVVVLKEQIKRIKVVTDKSSSMGMHFRKAPS
jgi:hypothetical protein